MNKITIHACIKHPRKINPDIAVVHPTSTLSKSSSCYIYILSDMVNDGANAVITSAELSDAVSKTASKATTTDGLPPKGPGVRKVLKKERKPSFSSVRAHTASGGKTQRRSVPVPPHRMTPLREQWMDIYTPVVTVLHLQIRMNLGKRCVELRTCKKTKDSCALQKGADFIKAFVLGFAISDAIALIRLDDLYIESFMVQDIRSTLKGDHLARAVGRVAGKDGKTKFTIENATKTRVVVADTRIHILGSYENTRLARRSISNLVLGAAPGKVYNKLRTVSARLNERRF